MRLLRLTTKDGRTALISSSAFAAAYEASNHGNAKSWVRTIGCSDDGEFAVLESPEQIAAMLAEEPPHKSALESAESELLDALKSLFDQSISDEESRQIVMAAIAKAEGRS